MARTYDQPSEDIAKDPMDGESGYPEGPSRKGGFGTRFKNHFLIQARLEHVDVLILMCCFVSGLVDSNAFNGMHAALLSLRSWAVR